MLTHKNFDITPGLPTVLNFEVLDDTYIKVDLTTYTTFKIEVLNEDTSLKFTSLTGFTPGIGTLTRTLTDTESSGIGTGLFHYRVVCKDSLGFSTLIAKGFFNVGEPVYSEISTPLSTTTILPDGSVYIGSPQFISFNVWYAITSNYRIIVGGVGFLSLDLRDNLGGVFIRTETFTNSIGDDRQWNPNFGQFTSFRIIQTYGSNSIKYLP